MTVPMMPPAAPAVGPRTAPGKGASSARTGHAADDSSNGSAEGQAAAESFAALLSSVQQPPVQPTPPQNSGDSGPDAGGDGQDPTDHVNHLVANLGMSVKELVDSVGPGEVGKLVRAAARPAGFSGGPDATQLPSPQPTQAPAAQTAGPATDPSVLAALESATAGTLTAAGTTDVRGSSAGHRKDEDASRLTALGTVTGSMDTGNATSTAAKLRAEDVSKGLSKGLATDATTASADKPTAGAAERAQAFTASMPSADDVRVIASTSASKSGRTGESDARRAEAPASTTTFALPPQPTASMAAAAPTTPVETVTANPNAALHEQLADPVLNVRARGNGSHLMIVEVHPESLGPVQVEVRIESGTTSVTVSGGAIAQDALRAALPQLHAELRAAGINDLNLNLGSSTQHQNHNPNQNQNSGFGFDAHSNNGQHNGWGAGGSGGSDRGATNPAPRGTGHDLTDDPASTSGNVRPTRTGTLDRAVDRWL